MEQATLTEDGTYSEKPDVYYKLMGRLKRKIGSAETIFPAPIVREEDEQDIGVIFYGSMENTIEEIDDILEEISGKKVSTLVEHFHCTVKLKRLLRNITR